MAYQEWHWRVFNVLVRLFGAMSVGAGVAFGFSSVYAARNPASQFEMLTVSGSAAVDFAVVAAFCLAVGILVIRAPAYRPDVASEGGRRSWWTGEPR